ncbi:MAG: PKD domain-containing protein [Saprospiraceae bacterium]|nr:PKD domain-containing protein [Saprospiraceae bacterium]
MKYLYLLAILMIVSAPAFSKHIIGGVFAYACNGGGDYTFTLKMYRDCSDPTGAYFDNNAPFSIYKQEADGTYTLLTTIFRNPQVVEDLDPADNPCVTIPPNVCVQEGIYTFDYQFTDWPSASSYHISYQRCCRNATVSNIETPDEVGATFTVELTPAAQVLCNNSPTFNSFPPIVICVNEPLVFDHSATDAEGDQLVYEFCAPLLGGGQGGPGGGGNQSCFGITPNPACPPPYTEASFVNPPYSPLNPMGGSPQMVINPLTGMLTGTPNVQGQFVVAVCVKEYRNGQLLSVIRRDFQFNVAVCQQLVDANLNTPGLTSIGPDYFLNTCYNLDIPFQNLSTNNTFVDSVQWEFDINGNTEIYTTWDVILHFPEAGQYEGRLVLNPGSECNDTANIFVEIYPEIVADFDYEYDTCVAGPVSFLDRSAILGAGQIVKWKWDLDPTVTDSIQRNPVHVYETPGTTFVKLEVENEHGCKDDTIRSVVYQPVPAIILVKPNDTISCAPATVFFNNQSSPIDANYDIQWSFGDGESGTDISPTHTYLDTGTFDVRLEITSPIGCYTDTTFSQLVHILSPPVADFSFDPTNPDNFNPVVNFFDESTDAKYWDWYVDGKLVAQMPDFTYTFPDTGLHEVTLIVVHPEKCLDTLVQYVDVVPEVTFYMPNAFTPNEDTVNDYFLGTGVTRGVTNYSLAIWDRYGQKIFETERIDEPWNGQVGNQGKPALNGLYVYVVSFTGPRGEPFEYRGYATLLR